MSSQSASRRTLSVGRYHFQHGPIDLIIRAEGKSDVVERCVAHCWDLFSGVGGVRGVLDALMQDLLGLKQEIVQTGKTPAMRYSVSKRMWHACAQHDVAERLTSMAAVAGSVADELIGCFHHDGIERAFINNGGDIAFYLTPGTQYVIGLHADPSRVVEVGTPGTSLVIDSASPIRGVATSGWRGRSFSFGIADAVTVLAKDAGSADAAATVIGNAVNIASSAIERKAADSLRDNADLGSRLVTTHVAQLTPSEIDAALQAGCECARRLLDKRIILGAVLQLQGSMRHVGHLMFESATGATADKSSFGKR